MIVNVLYWWKSRQRLRIRSWRIMRSYKSYFILILIPYIFLICMFHTQLQMYDRGPTQEELNNRALRYHSTPLLYPVIKDLSRYQEIPIGESKRKTQQRNLSQHPYDKESDVDGKHRVLEKLKQSNINLPIFNNSQSFLPASGSTTPSNPYANARLDHCASINTTDYPGFQLVSNGYVYSAFYDNRHKSGPPVVRIITLLKSANKPLFFCHFANPHSKNTRSSPPYLSVMSTYYEMCENHNKPYGGWMVNCEVPEGIIPCEVTITTHSQYKTEPEGYSAKLPVIMLRNPQAPRAEFALCVPPLFSYIPSTTLIEFVELSRILGVDHLVFYAHETPREIQKVLHYYQTAGTITVVKWNMASTIQDRVWYHGQLLAINDCLYRGMHRFKYLAFNDLDEFIVPHMQSNWSAMIKYLQNESPEGPGSTHAGYTFMSAFFDPLIDTSSHVLYDLESDLRTKSFSKVRTKVLVEADRIHELGIHHISKPTLPHYQTIPVPSNVAFLHHYRKCMTDFDPHMNCQIFARDESISQYIPVLRHNVHSTLWILKETEKLSYRDKYMNHR